MINWQYIEQIFSDAHVVDVDLSEWDRRVSLLVIADHIEWVDPQRLPVVLVHFLGARAIEIKFDHFHLKLPEGQHVQWLVDDLSRETTESGFRLTLFQARSASPSLRLEAAEIDVERVATADLDRAVPGWNRPGAPLVRLGIAALIRRGPARSKRR